MALWLPRGHVRMWPHGEGGYVSAALMAVATWPRVATDFISMAAEWVGRGHGRHRRGHAAGRPWPLVS